MHRSKVARLCLDDEDESAPSGTVTAGPGLNSSSVVDDDQGQVPSKSRPFQGNVPARRDVVAESPIFLPSQRNKAVLAFGGHLHYNDSKSIRGPFHWRCMKRRCSGVITTQESYPRSLDSVDADFGFRRPHTCGSTHADVLEYRDKRAWEYGKRKRSTGPATASTASNDEPANEEGHSGTEMAEAEVDAAAEEIDENEAAAHQSREVRDNAPPTMEEPEDSIAVSASTDKLVSLPVNDVVPGLDAVHDSPGCVKVEPMTPANKIENIHECQHFNDISDRDGNNNRDGNPENRSKKHFHAQMTEAENATVDFNEAEGNNVDAEAERNLEAQRSNQVPDEDHPAREKPEDSGVVSVVKVQMEIPSRVKDAVDDAPPANESDDDDDDNVMIISHTMPPPLRQPTRPTASFDGPRVCSFCQVAFSHQDEFRIHLKRELRVYRGKCICPECEIRCQTPAKMIDHVFIVHGGVEKLVCGVADCVKAFWTAEELRLHEASPHGSLKSGRGTVSVPPKARLQ